MYVNQCKEYLRAEGFAERFKKAKPNDDFDDFVGNLVVEDIIAIANKQCDLFNPQN